MAELAYVDVADVKLVHERLVVEFAASDDPISPSGVRSEDLLASAVWRQHTALGAELKYKLVHSLAATLMYGLIADHPFINGNKRTGVVATLQLIDRNRAYLETSEAELFEFVIAVGDHALAKSRAADEEVGEMTSWFQSRLRRLDYQEYPMKLRDLKPLLESHGCRFGEFDAGHVNIHRGGVRKRLAYHNWNEEVSVQNVHDLRRDLGLAEPDGVPSQAFYGSRAPIDAWINKHRTLLRRLGSR